MLRINFNKFHDKDGHFLAAGNSFYRLFVINCIFMCISYYVEFQLKITQIVLSLAAFEVCSLEMQLAMKVLVYANVI